MPRFRTPLFFLLLIMFSLTSRVFAADAQPPVRDHQRDGLSLNGEWQLLLEEAEAELWKPGVAASFKDWKTVSVPAGAMLKPGEPGMPKEAIEKIRSVWIRRTFRLDAPQASRDAVLCWNGVRFGATA